MRRDPTEQEFLRLVAIIEEVHWSANGVYWNQHLPEALKLYEKITTHNPSKLGRCEGCHRKFLDDLRALVNLPSISSEVSEKRKEARWAACLSCPAYRKGTKSCGRLFVDAFLQKPVLIDGEQVQPCGCKLTLKIHMKHAACPARRWPVT